MTLLEKGLSTVLIALLAGAAYLGHKTEVADLKRDLAASSSSVADFSANASSQSAYASSVVALGKQTAVAHASETAALSHLISTLQTAKEAINAAPDAATPYHYSDGLYDLMRQHAEDSTESGTDTSASASVDPS